MFSRQLYTGGNHSRYFTDFFSFLLLLVILLFTSPLYAQTTVSSSEDGAGTEYESSTENDIYEEALQTDIETMFGGSVEAVYGVQLMQPFNYTVSRMSSRLFTEVSFQNTSAKLSGTAEYNRVTPLRTGFELREAYGKYQAENWDICVGRQFIVWGQADGFRLTDRITAQDMREVTAVTGKNLPSDAVRFRFLHDIFTIDAVAIPFFTADLLPPFSFEYAGSSTETPPFTIVLPSQLAVSGRQFPIAYQKKQGTKPRRFIDTELGARISCYLPYIDFSFSGFYGWDKTPRFIKTADISPSGITVTLIPEYYRIGCFGGDATCSLGDFVFRFEAACIIGKYFEQKLPFVPSNTPTAFKITEPLKKNQYLALAGIDWLHDSWAVSMQYFEDLVFSGTDVLARGTHEGTVSISISKTLVEDRLKLSAAGLIGINHGDTASSYAASYALSDIFTVSAGADVYTQGYHGGGHFSALHSLTAAWIKACFTF